MGLPLGETLPDLFRTLYFQILVHLLDFHVGDKVQAVFLIRLHCLDSKGFDVLGESEPGYVCFQRQGLLEKVAGGD